MGKQKNPSKERINGTKATLSSVATALREIEQKTQKEIKNDFYNDKERLNSVSDYQQEKQSQTQEKQKEQKLKYRYARLKNSLVQQKLELKTKDPKLPPKAIAGKKLYRRGQAVSRSGRGIKSAGKGIKAAGKGLIVTAKAMKVVAKTLNAVAKAMRTAGKALMQAGVAMIKSGAYLCSTGIGAIAGVPMIAAGAVMAATGVATMAASIPVSGASVAMNLAAKLTHNSGKLLEKSGNALAKVGQKIHIRGNNMKVRGNNMYREAMGKNLGSAERVSPTNSQENSNSNFSDNAMEFAPLSMEKTETNQAQKEKENKNNKENPLQKNTNNQNTSAPSQKQEGWSITGKAEELRSLGIRGDMKVDGQTTNRATELSMRLGALNSMMNENPGLGDSYRQKLQADLTKSTDQGGFGLSDLQAEMVQRKNSNLFPQEQATGTQNNKPSNTAVDDAPFTAEDYKKLQDVAAKDRAEIEGISLEDAKNKITGQSQTGKEGTSPSVSKIEDRLKVSALTGRTTERNRAARQMIHSNPSRYKQMDSRFKPTKRITKQTTLDSRVMSMGRGNGGMGA